MKLISFIFPCYNEAENLEKLYEEMAKILPEVEKNYRTELICINDGSKDGTLEKLIELHQRDPRYKLINFSRNFGQAAGITAGMDYAKGDAVIVMDSDMQDPPALALEMIQKWEEGYEVVYAQRRKRAGESFFKKFTSYAFYRVLNSLAEVKIPEDTGEFKLLDRRVVEAVKLLRETNRSMRGIVAYTGFKQTAVLFDRPERFAGETKWSTKMLIRLAADSIYGYSMVPIRFITNMGIFVVTLSILGIFYAIYERLVHPETTASGWAFIIVAVLFLGGVQMIMLGIIGNYIGRIYSEVQDRPIYIISGIWDEGN